MRQNHASLNPKRKRSMQFVREIQMAHAMLRSVSVKGKLCAVTLTATDDDIPGQQLTFSLGTNSPLGAVINPTNGVFSWVPSGLAGTITNLITVVVTDNGKPNKSGAVNFRVIATDLNAGAVRGGGGQIILSWTALTGATYRVQYKHDLNATVWLDLPGDITATNGIAFKSDATTNLTRFYRVIALP
jgi:hypothetical protein